MHCQIFHDSALLVHQKILSGHLDTSNEVTCLCLLSFSVFGCCYFNACVLPVSFAFVFDGIVCSPPPVPRRVAW